MTHHHDFSKCYNFVIFGDFFIIPFLGVPKLAKFFRKSKKIFLMSDFIPLCSTINFYWDHPVLNILTVKILNDLRKNITNKIEFQAWTQF